MAGYKDFKPYTDGVNSIFQGLVNRMMLKRQREEEEKNHERNKELMAIASHDKATQDEIKFQREMKLAQVKSRPTTSPKDTKAEELGLAKQRARTAAQNQKTPFSPIQGVGEIKDLLDSLSGSKDRDFQSLSTDAIAYLTPIFNAKSDQDIIGLDDEAKASMLETLQVLKNNNILDQYNTQGIEKLLSTPKPQPQERKKGLFDHIGNGLNNLRIGITGAFKANSQPKDYYNQE